jgi:hypothetical protein
MKKFMLAATLVTVPSLAQASEGVVSQAQTLVTRGAQAQTVEQHMAVSAEYRKRVQEQEAKVREYSEEVVKLQKQQPDSLAMKWRHARPDPVSAAKERLVEAKRALQEAQDAAQHHAQLAMELWMKSNPAAQTGKPAENQANLTRTEG